MRGARAEASEVTSIIRNWYTSYGLRKKKKKCCCHKCCRAECLFCVPCFKCCPTGCFSCDVYEEGEESALEAKLKGILSDTMNDAVFVEDKATSRKTELSRDQKTSVELEESELQKGGRLHTLIVSYQDSVTGEASETVVLVDPKKAELMKMFQFASLTEPKNGQAGPNHADVGYAMLRKMADLDTVIDIQPKKKIENFKIVKKKDIPLDERLHYEIKPKRCCWCGPRWKYRQKKKAPIVKNVASKNLYGLLGFDPVVTNQPKKQTKSVASSLMGALTTAVDGTAAPATLSPPPSSAAASSTAVPSSSSGAAGAAGGNGGNGGNGNGKSNGMAGPEQYVNDMLDFGWDNDEETDGGNGRWRNGMFGCMNNGLVFNACLWCIPCHFMGQLWGAYKLPCGYLGGCCCGLYWPCQIWARWKVTGDEKIDDGLLTFVCPLVCPWCSK